jgi:hypothetical protein
LNVKKNPNGFFSFLRSHGLDAAPAFVGAADQGRPHGTNKDLSTSLQYLESLGTRNPVVDRAGADAALDFSPH